MTKMKWLGWINLYFLICGLALVAVLFNKSDVISSNKITKVEEHLHAKSMPTLTQIRGEVRQGYDIAEIIVSTPEKVEAGKTLFASNCASCHGKEGKGDGLAGARNFTSLEGWTNGGAISSIYETLQNGIEGSSMSSYSTLPVEDRMALAHFIRTLAKDYPAVSPADTKAFKEVYELDQDKKENSQVSVEVAIEQMAKEAQEAVEVKTLELQETEATPAQ